MKHIKKFTEHKFKSDQELYNKVIVESYDSFHNNDNMSNSLLKSDASSGTSYPNNKKIDLDDRKKKSEKEIEDLKNNTDYTSSYNKIIYPDREKRTGRSRRDWERRHKKQSINKN